MSRSHRLVVCDTKTYSRLTEITLSGEQFQALRPYLHAYGDGETIDWQEIGSALAFFVGEPVDAA